MLQTLQALSVHTENAHLSLSLYTYILPTVAQPSFENSLGAIFDSNNKLKYQEIEISAYSPGHASVESILNKSSTVIMNLIGFMALSTDRCANTWRLLNKVIEISQKRNLSLLLMVCKMYRLC